MGLTQSLKFRGELLQRGFWLYVWEITTFGGKRYYYVGRTGDSSSPNAQSPFNRMGQHLGFNEHSNVLRRHLERKGIAPEKCEFQLVAYGPILKEAMTIDEHRISRDVTAALEKALGDAMLQSGYNVFNPVHCQNALDNCLWSRVRKEFASHFPKLEKEKPKRRI